MESEAVVEQVNEPSKPEKSLGTAFSIWPPSQRTRDAVTNRLIETLSTSSVLSKRYGTIPRDDASALASAIEEEAFAAAGGSSTAEDDGIEILQVYSKEISKRMLEAIKSRASSVPSAETNSPVASSISPDEISS